MGPKHRKNTRSALLYTRRAYSWVILACSSLLGSGCKGYEAHPNFTTDQVLEPSKFTHMSSHSRTLHPEDNLIAIFFDPPKCSEDTRATLKIFVRGLLQDVNYNVVVQVQSPENMIHEESSALEGSFIHRTIPPLTWAAYGTYTIRVSVYDSLWASGRERLLSTMVRPLELGKRPMSCSDHAGVILPRANLLSILKDLEDTDAEELISTCGLDGAVIY
jgi:hypothetical protein